MRIAAYRVTTLVHLVQLAILEREPLNYVAANKRQALQYPRHCRPQ